MDFIVDQLAIGNVQDALAPPNEITALLCVAQEIDVHPSTGVYHKVPLQDMVPIPTDQLEQAVHWLRDHVLEHHILVFCNAGVGRSSSVVIGYLCCILGYQFGDAVEMVAARRPYMSILPNLVLTIRDVGRRLQSSP